MLLRLGTCCNQFVDGGLRSQHGVVLFEVKHLFEAERNLLRGLKLFNKVLVLVKALINARELSHPTAVNEVTFIDGSLKDFIHVINKLLRAFRVLDCSVLHVAKKAVPLV